MKNRTGMVSVGLLLAIATVYFLRGPKSIDDRALKALLVGTWRAEDVANAALNNRKTAVAHEEVVIKPDGTLKYLVIPKPGEGEAAADDYAWEVAKGKLRLRHMGHSRTQDEIPSIPISVDQARLSLRLRGYSTKVFERVTS